MMTNLLSSNVARLRFLLVMLVMMFATTEMWGAISSPSVCVFASSSETTLSDDNNDVTWTASTQPTGFENDGDKRGLQWSGSIVGDGGLTLSCSNYASYTITKIEVVWSRNNSAGASVSATVGGSAFGTTDSNTQKTTNRTATFSGSAKGNIIITATSTATKNSFYIKSITVTYESGGSSTIAVTNVTLNESALALTEGDTEQLIATIEPDNATNKNVSWESNNLSVATVVDGLVTAVAEGNAIITVTTEDGNITANCNVSVSASAGGGGEGECSWTLVTDASTLKAGDRVVIAAKDYNYAMSIDQKSNNRGQASITKNNSNITFGNDVQILTLSDGKSAGTLAFNTGSGYLYAASSSDNYLRTENTLSNNSSWSVTIANDGTATLKAQGTNTRNTMQYNQSSSLFACYSSASQKALAIYKEICTGGSTETSLCLIQKEVAY